VWCLSTLRGRQDEAGVSPYLNAHLGHFGHAQGLDGALALLGHSGGQHAFPQGHMALQDGGGDEPHLLGLPFRLSLLPQLLADPLEGAQAVLSSYAPQFPVCEQEEVVVTILGSSHNVTLSKATGGCSIIPLTSDVTYGPLMGLIWPRELSSSKAMVSTGTLTK